MALPAQYSGEAVDDVVVSCFRYLYIEMQPQKFVTKWSKVAFLISLLSGRALLWARAIWNSQSTLINSFDAFTAHFREVFGRPTSSLSVADQLIRLRQGSASTDDYTLQFCTLAASSGWNEAALLAVYRQGLNPQIRTMMAIYDDAVGLESFMQRAVKYPNASPHANWVKPPSHQPHPLPVLQFQNPCMWILGSVSLLWIFRALHQDVPFSFHMPNGEYPPVWTRYFNLTSVNSPTTHPKSFRFSVSPPRLGLIGKLHLPNPSKAPQPPTEKANSGAPYWNNPGKAAWSTVLLPCPYTWDVFTMRQSPFWYWRGPPWTSSWDTPG